MQQLQGELETAPRTEIATHTARSYTWLVWAIPLLLYVALCVPLYERYQNSFSGDGVAYLRRAEYLAAGDFSNAISGYWSPLIIFLIAPVIRAGVDSVYAGHAVNTLLGLANIIALGLLLARFTAAPLLVRGGAMVVAALFTATWSIRYIAPDGLMAALFFGCLLLFSRRDFLGRPSWQLLAGAVGGLAYLAKAYALPYFLATMPVVIVLLAWRDQRLRDLLKPAFRAIAITALGFFLVAGPWILVLSIKYGRPTASLAASRAHALVGPVMNREYYPDWGVPPDPFICHWENPQDLRYDFWSPFASRELFNHQLKVIARNIRILIEFAEEWASLEIAPAILPVGVLVLLTGFGLSRRRIELGVLVLALGIYVGGLLPLFLSQRYVIHIALPLLIAIALLLIYEWKRHADGGASHWRHRIAAALLLCFAIGGWLQARDTIYAAGDGLTLRLLAEEAHKMGLKGPMASNDRARGNAFAFFSDFKHLGSPPASDLAEADRLLRDAGVEVLFIYRSPSELREPSLPTRLADENSAWRQVLQRGRVEIFIRDETIAN